MSDDKITALVALMREYAKWNRGVSLEQNQKTAQVLEDAADALEASAQAPAAVDRMALARYFYIQDNAYSDNAAGRWAGLMERVKAGREPAHGDWSCFRKADALIASGILQDAAEVEARALEELEKALRSTLGPEPDINAEWIEHRAYNVSKEAVEKLRERAAAIREGRA